VIYHNREATILMIAAVGFGGGGKLRFDTQVRVLFHTNRHVTSLGGRTVILYEMPA
jgi:hypothetical protein